MKAKEYAAEYNRVISEAAGKEEYKEIEYEALRTVINGLITELKELSLKRGTKTTEAAYSCWLEINTKWIAFTRLATVNFNPEGFRKVLALSNPEFERILKEMESLNHFKKYIQPKLLEKGYGHKIQGNR